MNGRKAKLFRALADVSTQNQANRSYHGIQHTVRNRQLDHPTELDTDGKPVVLVRYQTATHALNQGARLLNKMMKKQYKRAQSSSQKNMLVA